MKRISKAVLGLNLMYSFSWCQTTKGSKLSAAVLDLRVERKLVVKPLHLKCVNVGRNDLLTFKGLFFFYRVIGSHSVKVNRNPSTFFLF